MKNLLKKVFKHWELFLVIFLILEFVVFGAANPKFLRPKSIMNSIVNYISVCIISLFVTLSDRFTKRLRCSVNTLAASDTAS